MASEPRVIELSPTSNVGEWYQIWSDGHVTITRAEGADDGAIHPLIAVPLFVAVGYGLIRLFMWFEAYRLATLDRCY